MRVIIIVFVVLFCAVFEVISAPKRVPCPTIAIQHGRVRYRTKNRFVKFTCDTGYILAGERYSTCVNGKWDAPMPKCVRPTCTKVIPPPNVIIYPSHRGGVLNFFCKPGYVLRGDNVTYCNGSKWDNRLPTCTETTKSPAVGCDFETEDLCGWNHDILHDFNWIRKNFKTPSGHLGTGPSYDHTKGVDSNGYYMYIESSYRNENDTARLISPIFDKMDDGDVCLRFFYHMYGSTTGQLRVYLKKISDSWDLDPERAVFWKTGNHGNVWLASWHNLGIIDEDFQIIIEGVRGKTHYSDIAIDDVEIVPNCTDLDFTTENDIMYSFDDESVPSCVNRCDSPSNSTTYNCDCDDSCIDNNTCCLDYMVVCVLGGTEEYDGTTNNVLSTSLLPKLAVTTSTKLATTMKTTVTTITTTSKRPLTTTPIRKTSRPTQKMTTPIQKTKIKKTTRIRATSTMKSMLNDIVTIPQITTQPDQEEILTFKTVTIINQNTVRDVKMPSTEKEQANTSTIIIIACVTVFVIGMALIVFGIRRYRFTCRNLKKMKGSNGDSQSDVRFLTSDEILNFNLAYVDD